jgi:hypothetical protein
MRKSWLLCVLLGTLAWGQAQPEAPPAPAGTTTAPSAAIKAPAEVPESAVVLTIKGVCPPAKTAATAKAGASKTAAAKKPADCKTEITRAEFEKIANGLSPNVSPQLKRQLEQALPRFIAMSEAAKEKGLENTEHFKEKLKIAKMQILTQELQQSVQEEADKIPAEKVAQYYKDNPEAYQQYSLDRLFIPRYKQAEAEDKEETKEQGKLTEEQQKAKEAEDKAKQEKGEQELTKLADTLRERAAAGEDFAKLQKEAFEAAGTKVDNPTVNLPKVRRTGLPPAHAEVFDLKVGEVSKVITDNGGHYIYKVVSKDVLPLDQVKDEIHNKMKSERTKEMMDKYTNSFQSIPNEAYFGPPAPAGPGGMGMRQGPPPHMPRPQMAPPPTQPQATPQSAPPPAQQAPPSNPN